MSALIIIAIVLVEVLVTLSADKSEKRTCLRNNPMCVDNVESLHKVNNVYVEKLSASVVNRKFLVLPNVCVEDTLGGHGMKVSVDTVTSRRRLYSERWGPSGRRNYSIIVEPLDGMKKRLWLNRTVAYLWTPLIWSMKNAYHTFDELHNIPKFLNLAEKLSDDGRVIPLLAHFTKRWNVTTYFQILGSMTNGSRLYSKKNLEVCFRRLVMKIPVKIEDLRKTFVGLQEKSVDSVLSSRSLWCNALFADCKLPKKTTVTIIQRLRSRKILNLDYLVKALKKQKWAVNVVNFECMNIHAQFIAVQNSTTLIGTHGAGLSWSRWLHRDAAEIQLIGFPCAFEARSRMDYAQKYSIHHADIHATTLEINQTVLDHLCEIRKKPIHELDVNDKALRAATDYDVRNYDTVVDIPALVNSIKNLDPTYSDRLATGRRV